MIKPLFVVIAEAVIRDAETNRITIVNVAEEFRPAGFPLLLPRFVVLAVLVREDEANDPLEATVQLSVRLGEAIVTERDVVVSFPMQSRLNRMIVEFQGFAVMSPGDIVVSIGVGDLSASTFPVRFFPAGTVIPDPKQV